MNFLVILILITFIVIMSCDDAFASPTWQTQVDGQIWSVDMSSDGHYLAAGTDINATAGRVYFYKDSSLLWTNQQDRVISNVSVSEDGSFVLASGYQLMGRAGIYHNSAMYLFDQDGNLLWVYQNTNKTNLNQENQFLTGEMMATKKIAMISDEEIMYLDYDGNVLWNYTMPGRIGPMEISANGSTVAIGVNGYLDDTWWLYVFDDFGNLLWKYEGSDGFVQGRAVSLSSGGEKIAIGSMASGDYGSLYMFDHMGTLLWKHNVDGGILRTEMSSDGAFTVVESNYGVSVFDEIGNNTDTKTAFYAALSSDDSLVVAAKPVADFYDLVFFDTQLNPILTERIPLDIEDIDSNGKKVAVGTRQHNELGKSGKLYLFENITQKNIDVNYVDFRSVAGEIVPPCEGTSSIAGYTKEHCLFVRYIQMPLIIGIVISAIIIGVIIWRKRK